jgi:hypothetical protein
MTRATRYARGFDEQRVRPNVECYNVHLYHKNSGGFALLIVRTYTRF